MSRESDRKPPVLECPKCGKSLHPERLGPQGPSDNRWAYRDCPHVDFRLDAQNLPVFGEPESPKLRLQLVASLHRWRVRGIRQALPEPAEGKDGYHSYSSRYRGKGHRKIGHGVFRGKLHKGHEFGGT